MEFLESESDIRPSRSGAEFGSTSFISLFQDPSLTLRTDAEINGVGIRGRGL